ncbi:MAG: hypothetical protein UZ22_OP11002000239, partial [Microgenomates bacterium OLB23]
YIDAIKNIANMKNLNKNEMFTSNVEMLWHS